MNKAKDKHWGFRVTESFIEFHCDKCKKKFTNPLGTIKGFLEK